jgi:hypothetical protein
MMTVFEKVPVEIGHEMVLRLLSRDQPLNAPVGDDNGAVGILSPRERRIFEARWLSDVPPTLKVLGDEFGISEERARQIEVRAGVKVKRAVKSDEERAKTKRVLEPIDILHAQWARAALEALDPKERAVLLGRHFGKFRKDWKTLAQELGLKAPISARALYDKAVNNFLNHYRRPEKECLSAKSSAAEQQKNVIPLPERATGKPQTGALVRHSVAERVKVAAAAAL